jgi:AcrR family transcriptional regulator
VTESSPDPRPGLREATRDRMRTSILTAARDLSLEVGWGQVRLTAVAERACVSRPTVYSLFEGKPGLARSLVAQEAQRVIMIAARALDEHSDSGPVAAVAAAVAAALAAGESNSFLRKVLGDGAGREPDLLRYLTVDADPIHTSAWRAMLPWARNNFPGVGVADLSQVVDAVVRLVLSHLVLPGADRHLVSETVAGMAVDFLAGRATAAARP